MEAEPKPFCRLWRQWRRFVLNRACAACIMSCAGLRIVHECPLFVLLTYESLQRAVHLVHVYGYLRFDVTGVVEFVRLDIAGALHVIDLRMIPFVHAQRLDLRDVGSKLAVKGSASHAQENADTPAGPSWIARAAVGTLPVTWDRLDELLQCPLVARLLALVESGGHDVVHGGGSRVGLRAL